MAPNPLPSCPPTFSPKNQVSKCKEQKAERRPEWEQTLIKLTGMTFADIDFESSVLDKLQVTPPPPPCFKFIPI